MSPISLRVRELRLAKGWTQVQLAERAGVRQATISKLEKSESKMVELRVLEAVAVALGVEPGELIVREPKRGRGRG